MTPTGYASPSASCTTTGSSPSTPPSSTQLAAWRAAVGPDDSGLLITNHGRPLNRYSVNRIVKRVGQRAGIDGMHAHRLRHTLATQAINRGMSLEAIAALLGHRSMRMTLIYARIADRTVADEYYAVTEQVEALYDADTGPAGQRRRTPDAPAPRRDLPAAARQRLLHPTPRARLCLRERSARPAPTTRPASSSNPCCSANATTPSNTTSPERAELFNKLLDGIDNGLTRPSSDYPAQPGTTPRITGISVDPGHRLMAEASTASHAPCLGVSGWPERQPPVVSDVRGYVIITIVITTVPQAPACLTCLPPSLCGRSGLRSP